MRKLSFYIFLTLISSYSFTQNLGYIKGTVLDSDSKVPIWNARIALTQNGVIKGTVKTDFDGIFQFNSLKPGKYDVNFEKKDESYWPGMINGVIVTSNKFSFTGDLYLTKAQKTIQKVNRIYGNTISEPTILHLSNDTIIVYPSKDPEFQGGKLEMIEFILENLNPSDSFIDKNNRGTVSISFVVEKDGSLTNIEVLQGLNVNCDTEAKRVIESMPNWAPGQLNGNIVKSKAIVRIPF